MLCNYTFYKFLHVWVCNLLFLHVWVCNFSFLHVWTCNFSFLHVWVCDFSALGLLGFWILGRLILSIIFWPKVADYIIYYLLSSKCYLVLYTQYHSTPVHRQNDRSPFNPGWRWQKISKYTVLQKIIFLHYQGCGYIIIVILYCQNGW